LLWNNRISAVDFRFIANEIEIKLKVFWINAERRIRSFNPSTRKRRIDVTPDIRILHIDLDYKISLMVIEKNISTMSHLSLREALKLIKTQELDLILSEPQQMAIFDKTNPPNPINRPLCC
jgi:hypothetical protein